MSLDLYLTSIKKRERKGTGVFVRKNGANYELQTIEEVKEHFPNMDVSNIEVVTYYEEKMFCGNITHNLCEMAEHVLSDRNNLYQLLWRPFENGYTTLGIEYKTQIGQCYEYLKTHREQLSVFNPSNGWGDYDVLLVFVKRLYDAIATWDGKEEVSIVVYR